MRRGRCRLAAASRPVWFADYEFNQESEDADPIENGTG
jgi:hypothetical protein